MSSPDFLDLLCSHISMGGSAIDFCSMHECRYDEVIRWIYGDKARGDQYNGALDARGEWMIQRVLLELKRMSTVDPALAYDDNNCLVDVKNIPAEMRACIAEISVFEEFQGAGKDREFIGYTRKVKFWDKNSALEKLGKTLALFVERHDHTHRGNITHMGEITVVDEVGVAKPLRFDLGSKN